MMVEESGVERLSLSNLKVANFKNYRAQILTFDSQLNCFVGKNGMGKTNLLDAVYYLCMGKSKFKVPDKSIVRQQERFFRLEGKFDCCGKYENITASVLAGKKKELKRNDIAYKKLSHHIGLLPIVFIAPDDTSLILEGSEERRRFVDNTLSQIDPDYLRLVIQYHAVLKRRNILLKQYGEHNDANLLYLIDIIGRQLIEPGRIIHEKRSAFLREVQPIFQHFHRQITQGNETASISYKSKLHEEDFGELLIEAKPKDILLQRTTIGIHKDDLYFGIDDLPIKQFGSQGQLKSFLLALRLAEYEILKKRKKKFPILILDDLFDRLDEERVNQIIALIAKSGFGQIFISDTHLFRIRDIAASLNLKGNFFKIHDGSAKLL